MNQDQRQLLSDCNLVLQLRFSPAWAIIERDAKANFDDISSTWFNLPEDSQQLREARARQIANADILGLLDKYENLQKEVAKEVAQSNPPDTYQVTDVDNGIEENNDE